MRSLQNKPWIAKLWHVSPYNFVEEVTSQMNFAEKIMISDCTLREGEQEPGVVFRRDDKLKMAHALDEIGIPELEVSYLAVAKEERATVSAIVKAGLSAKIRVVCRAVKSDIDMARDCGCTMVSVSLPAGYLQLESKLRWPEDKVIETAVQITNYAHQQGLNVTMSPFDTARTNFDFLVRYLKAVVTQGHADRVRVVDTVAAASPSAIKYLVRKVIEVTLLPVEVHCHNDFGLGTANTLAGIEAGASVASTSLNGMGERGGLGATEEVALALQILYGVDLGLKYEKLYNASLLLQKLSRVKVQRHKPVVGDNAFTQESGLVVAGWLRDPFTAVSYLPELVGHSGQVLLGKGSGKEAIKLKLAEAGIEANDDQVAEILLKVKKKAMRTKSVVSNKVFARICEKVLPQK